MHLPGLDADPVDGHPLEDGHGTPYVWCTQGVLTCHPNCQGDEHHPSCELLAWETDTDLWLTGNACTERRPGGLVRRIPPAEMFDRQQRAEVQRIITGS